MKRLSIVTLLISVFSTQVVWAATDASLYFSCTTPPILVAASVSLDSDIKHANEIKTALEFGSPDALRSAAESGEVIAQIALGQLHLGLRKDFPLNVNESRRWFEKAAASGSQIALAFLDIVQAYSNDQLDIDVAIESLTRHYEKGLAEAATRVGVLYEFNKKDKLSAKNWYIKAIESGDGAAVTLLKDLHFSLEKMLVDDKRQVDPDVNSVYARLYATIEKGFGDLEKRYMHLSVKEQQLFDCVYTRFLHNDKVPPSVRRDVEIYSASRVGDMTALKNWLSTKNLNVRRQALPYVGENLAEWALRYGQADVLSYVLAQGLDVPKVIGGVSSALAWAASRGDLDVVKRILDQFSLDEKNGATFAAAKSRQIAVARYLIEKGADANTALPSSKQSLLHVAVALNDIEFASFLLLHGADVNAQERSRGSAIFQAVKKNYYDIAQLLIRSGADLSLKDGRGRGVLDIAKQRNDRKMISLIQSSM